MKVGLGITTTEARGANIEVQFYTDDNTKVFVHVDKDRNGVSYSRNKCLSELKDCDYIFLMDDDVKPIMSGWEKYFISAAERSGLHHFTLPEAFKTEVKGFSYPEILEWNGAIGCFRFMTKKCLETVGGFNTAYDRYGFEDAGYTERVFKSGINGALKYPSPLRSTSYIFSEDVYARNPKPNLTYEEKQALIVKNRPIYINEIQSEQIFYPYDQD